MNKVVTEETLKDTIENFFADTSRSKQETYDTLSRICDIICEKLDILDHELYDDQDVECCGGNCHCENNDESKDYTDLMEPRTGISNR